MVEYRDGLPEVAGSNPVYTAKINNMAKNKEVEKEYKKEGLRRAKIRKEKRKVRSSRMCKCGRNKKASPHTCPYDEDMHGDYYSTCTCCYDCERSCAGDI